MNYKMQRSRSDRFERSVRFFTLHRHSRRSVLHARTTTTHCVLYYCPRAYTRGTSTWSQQPSRCRGVTRELGESHPSQPPTSTRLHTTHTRDHADSLQHNTHASKFISLCSHSFFFSNSRTRELIARSEKAGRQAVMINPLLKKLLIPLNKNFWLKINVS